MSMNVRKYFLILRVCLSVTVLIVDLLQFFVCCIRSGVTRCTHLNDTLPGPYVPERITRGALVAHRYTYAPPRCIAGLCSPLSDPLEWSCWPRVWRWGTDGFQEQGQCFFIGLNCSIPTIVFYYFSFSLLPVYRLVLWGWGLRTDRVYITRCQPCTADLF